MKKRIEKVVECVKDYNYLTIGKKYIVYSESKERYSVKDDEGDIACWGKDMFKKEVSEREVLEFEVNDLTNKNAPYYNPCYQAVFNSKIDLTNFDIKVIATPKDSPYEGKSREELIEIIKELKSEK